MSAGAEKIEVVDGGGEGRCESPVYALSEHDSRPFVGSGVTMHRPPSNELNLAVSRRFPPNRDLGTTVTGSGITA